MKIFRKIKALTAKKQNNSPWGVLKYSIFISVAIVIIGLSVGIGFRLNNSNSTQDSIDSNTRTTTPTTTSGGINNKDTQKQTTTPTKTNPSTSTQSTKPYKPPVCTKTVIPYKTTTDYVTYLSPGQTTSYGGYDGYKETCTDYTGRQYNNPSVPAIDKKVTIGASGGQSSTTPQEPTVTYAQAVAYCNSIGATSNTSAHEVCINAYISNNGP